MCKKYSTRADNLREKMEFDNPYLVFLNELLNSGLWSFKQDIQQQILFLSVYYELKIQFKVNG